MNALKSVIAVLFVSFSGVISMPVLADQGAVELLNKMNRALHDLTYTGRLAYLKGNSLSTLEIDHRVSNGVESESVVRVSNATGKISREQKGFSLASIPKVNSKMSNVYSFDVGRSNRIANLPCVIITARPKDRARYLQKFCINRKTGMLLDYMLVNKSHKPVERFIFTTINISSSKHPLLEESGSMGFSQPLFKLLRKNQLRLPNLDDGWMIDALPRGFGIRRGPNVSNSIKQYIISDGLSSLSLFISPFTKSTPISNARLNSGALNVLTRRKYNSFITVVGEVPENTLKRIINNIRRK